LLRSQTIPFGRPFALGAYVALTEAHIKQMLQAGVIIRKLCEELANVGLFHGSLSL
jgi:hypothetical protein